MFPFENKTTLTTTNIKADADEIRRLPQFHRGSLDYVYRLGGTLYRAILDRAPFRTNRKYISIDSRVHMLMPGFLPCIGGWHCDDFYRPTGKQPDLPGLMNRPNLMAVHHAFILGTEAPTIFAAESFSLPDEALRSEHVYHDCHRYIEELNPKTFEAPESTFVSFNSLTFHRGQRSKGSGWRLFLRITESDHYQPLDEIRTQTQVYLVDERAGW